MCLLPCISIYTLCFLRFFLEVTLVYHTICCMSIPLYFYFYIHDCVITTKNLVSVHHHTNKPFYQFCSPLPSCNHSSVSVSLLLFGLVYSFILSLYVCVLYSRCELNHTVFVFFHLNYFYYAYYTLKESGGLQSHKVTKSRT